MWVKATVSFNNFRMGRVYEVADDPGNHGLVRAGYFKLQEETDGATDPVAGLSVPGGSVGPGVPGWQKPGPKRRVTRGKDTNLPDPGTARGGRTDDTVGGQDNQPD